MVFYRKYRPQSLTDLIGQEHVKNNLLKSYLSEKLAHAYLFCGPRGTGKTSTARILAKMVNCEVEDKSKSPCNNCTSCLTITDGSNLDLIEIDAASNRGIDDIRDLRERVKLAPTNSQKKIYIIDEVHMLTTEAFNALLKTLEEPPTHVLFILATTEVHKLPQTILSRVQRLDFNFANRTDLLKGLEHIVEKEKIEADADALDFIAQKADGSFRDAVKLLDQLNGTGEKITLKNAQEIFKSGTFEDITALVESLTQKDAPKGLALVQSLIEKGVNFKEFTSQTLEILRQILLIKNGVDTKEDLGTQKFETLKNLSNNFAMQQLLKSIEKISNSQEKSKFVSIPSLPLEIAIVESCLNVIASEVKQSPVISAPIQSIPAVSVSTPIIVGTPLVVETEPTDNAPVQNTEDILTLKDKWTYILETIKPFNFSLEALLKQANVISVEEGRVTLEVPYSFHQRILEAPKSRTLLESVLADVLGKPAKVYTVLGKRPVRIEEVANVEVAADDEIVKIAAEIFNS